MLRPIGSRLVLFALLACACTTAAAAQMTVPTNLTPPSPEQHWLPPLWQSASAPVPAAFEPKRPLPTLSALSLPGDAAWEGWRTPGVALGLSHFFTEWQGKLVIAGSVYAAGHTACNSLVVWDGSNYEALPNAGSVQFVTTWNGQLVVAVLGPFPNYQNHSILKYNGSAWELLGVTNHYPSCMLEFDGKLVIGGQFTSVGGVAASHIAWYDGVNWAQIGAGFASPSGPEALVVHAGDLFALGPVHPSSGLAAWNETTGEWEARAGVVSGILRALASDGVNLYVAGRSLVGAGLSLGGLGRWDGSQWHAIIGAAGRDAQDVTVWDGTLISTIDIGVGELSRSVGDALTEIPGDSLGFGQLSSSSAIHLGTWGNRLVASGTFLTSGVQRIPNVAVYDGAQWSTLAIPWDASMRSPNWSIQSMLNWNGKLVVAGAGGLVADQDHYEMATCAAVFDGAHWAPLSPNFILAQYRWLTTWNGDIVVGGYSVSIQGTTIQRMGRWDGANWHPLGTGAPDFVLDMQEFQGELYATEDRGDYGGLARFNGTTWQSAGGGISGGAAWTLAVHGDQLVAGGTFTQAGGLPAAGIATWNGTSWSPLGAGLTGGPVETVASWNGVIVAGGQFTASGAQPLDGAAYWDGVNWNQMGSNVARLLYAKEYYGELFASGYFRLPDDSEILTLAKWTGTDWLLLGSGSNDYEFAIAGDHLYAAGYGVVHGHVSHGLSRVPLAAVLDAPKPQPNPSRVALAASPNPASARMQFTFTLPAAGRARLTVLDLAGRVVATLADDSYPAGEHHATWAGAPAPGVYFARLQLSGGASQVLRVARME